MLIFNPWQHFDQSRTFTIDNLGLQVYKTSFPVNRKTIDHYDFFVIRLFGYSLRVTLEVTSDIV